MDNILLVDHRAFGQEILWSGQEWAINGNTYKIRDFAGLWKSGRFSLVVMETSAGDRPKQEIDSSYAIRPINNDDFDKLFSCQQDAINYWVSINGWSLKIVRRCGENFYRIPYTYDDLPNNDWEFTLNDFLFASRIASLEIATALLSVVKDDEVLQKDLF